MTILKRISAAALVLCMAFALAACSDGGGGSQEPVKTKLENVYKVTTVPLPEGVENLYNYAVIGDRVAFISTDYDENGSVSKIQTFSLDGGGVETLLEVSNTYDPDATVQVNRYLQSLGASPDGSLWTYENEYTEDNSDPNNYVYEDRNILRKMDFEGNELGVINLNDVIEDDYIYVDQMIFDADGNLYVNYNTKIYVFDGQKAEYAFTINESDYIYFAVATAGGEVLYGTYAGDGMVFKKINFAEKAAGASIPNNSNRYFYQAFPGSGDYAFYYMTDMGITGFNLDTMESTEVINFINSDLDGNQLQNMVPLLDGRFMVAERDYSNWSFKNMLVLEEKPDAENVEKILLTLATMYMSQDTRRNIIEFNKSNEEYRITILDYSQYNTSDNYMAGYEQLNNDLIAGRIPDIISLENLQVSNYVSKGLLADLNPLIESDPELSRDMLLENILEAGSTDGKLYQLVPSFTIMTAVGKTANVGTASGWTVEELQALMARAPEGAQAFNNMERSTFLLYTVLMSIDEFINWDTGTCSFDTPDFIGLLEVANSFPESIDWQNLYSDWDLYMQMMESAYKEDKILLEMTSVYNIRAVRDMKTTFDGQDINFIGIPTPTKQGSAISPNCSFGISSQTKYPEACWQFLRTLLLEESAFSSDSRWLIPTNKNALNKMLAEEMTPVKDRDLSKGVTLTEMHPGGGMSSWTMDEFDDPDGEYDNYHLTQAEADQVMNLITSVNTILYNNQSVMEIITEEAESFFSGQKSAQAAAEIIQSRLQIYVSESK